MRLKTVRTKNTIQYSIIQDITTINGKRTTKIYENLGTIDKIKLRCGKEEPLTWVFNYILKLNQKAKEERLPIIITKYENRLIDKNIQNSCFHKFSNIHLQMKLHLLESYIHLPEIVRSGLYHQVLLLLL